MTPAAAGAGFGEALQRIGTGVADVAEAMDYRDQIKAKADSDTAYGEYMEHRRQVLYDPETGYLNTRGGNAGGDARAAALDELAKRRAAVEAGLSPRAQQDFARRADGVDEQVQDAAIQHDSTQLRNYTSASTTAAIEASLAAAGMAYNDEAASDAYLQEALLGLREKALLEGTPPEALANARRELISGVTAQKVTNMAYDDPIIADQYLDASVDKMDRNEYLRLKKGLKPAVLARKADRTIAPMFAPGGAASARPRSEAAAWQAAGILSTASTVFGMDENAQNDAIRQYLSDGGAALDPSTTAWCAAFVNATLGHQGMSGTSSNMARSFLDWGVPVEGAPLMGDIVVLERGNPPYGHVGFFQGYNADGTMRVLGGNVGDKVAASSYSADQVLGIRRATDTTPGEAPTNAQLSGGLDAIMSEPDIELREVMLKGFEQRLKVRDMQDAMQRETLMDDGWERIVNGENPDNLSPEVQIEIGAGGMGSLRQAYENKVTGTDVTDDAVFQHFLDQSLSSDPVAQREFADTNLNDFAGELSASVLTSLKTAQADLRRERDIVESGRASELVYKREDFGKAADSAIEQFQAVVGQRPKSGTATKATTRAWNQFNSALTDAMANYANENGRQMPPDLLNQTIGVLLMPVTVNPPGMFAGARDTIAATLPFREGGSEVTLNMDQTDVPMVDRTRLTNYLTKVWSKPPTQQEVVDHYELELIHSLGLHPDIEYTDIPKGIRDTIKKQNPRASDQQVIDFYLDTVVENARR